jgi:hypothetical protein
MVNEWSLPSDALLDFRVQVTYSPFVPHATFHYAFPPHPHTSKYSPRRFGDQDPAVTCVIPVASSAWLLNERGKRCLHLGIWYRFHVLHKVSRDFRERFGVAETMRFVAMVLYPESVNFILHHGSQPDLSFNQEFPLGVTFLYFVRPDGHTYDLICFSPV